MNLDLKQLLAIARRRWWIVVILMTAAGAMVYISASRETKLYAASASMLINPGQSFSGSSTYDMLMLTDRLVETYPRLITGSDMRHRVAKAIGAPVLSASVSASVSSDSQLIVISVVDTDPERAALVANTVVSEFDAYLSEQAQSRAQDARQVLDGQIAALQGRLDELDSRIQELDTDANVDDRQVQRKIDDLSQERATINAAMVNLNAQSVTISSQVIASSARVQPVGVAVAPSQPFVPQPRRSAMLGVVVGFMLGIGLVALLEYLDNTVKPGYGFRDLIDAPLLATVPALARLAPGREQIFALNSDHFSAAEAVRLLRTNLDFIAASSELRAITITSPGEREGKSTTAANLAVVLAQAGLRTVLIDADLRKPTLATVFGVSSGSGLTTLLVLPETRWTDVARDVGVPGLQLIPSGPIPPNPSDLVGSRQLETVLGHIKDEADWVVIDAPPVLAASDALAIAAHTDGMVLVAVSHKTRIDAVRHAADVAHQAGIRLIGVVLNRQKGQRGASIYGDYQSLAELRTRRKPRTVAPVYDAVRRDPLPAGPPADGLH